MPDTAKSSNIAEGERHHEILIVIRLGVAKMVQTDTKALVNFSIMRGMKVLSRKIDGNPARLSNEL